MLEDYYVRPSTVDKVRASWLAPQIESYLGWLEAHRYSRLIVYRRLPLLFHFGEFAQKKGCKDVASCKAYIKEFVSWWLEEHGAKTKTAIAVRKHAIDAECGVRQMLQLASNEPVKRNRRRSPFPLESAVPGFAEYLHSERGFAESTIRNYRRHLSEFAQYLSQTGISSFSQLSPAVLALSLCSTGRRWLPAHASVSAVICESCCDSVTARGSRLGISAHPSRAPGLDSGISGQPELLCRRVAFTSGTAVNAVTRSGSNDWHGSVHAWFGDDHTNASNYFAPKSGSKAFQQDFVTGFALGGPVAKNKLFLFTAFEFVKGDTPQFRGYAHSDAAKGIGSDAPQQDYVNELASSGDAELQAIAGQLQFLLDPSNFPNAANLLVPNTGAFNDWKKFYNWVTRIDYQPTAADTLTFRFSYLQDNGSRMWALDPSNAPDDATLGFWRDYTLLGAWSHVFGPRMINQLRVQVVPHNTGDSPVVSPHTAYLRIAGLGQFGGEHYQPFSALERRFQFEDSVTVTRIKHTIKFGASYRPFSYALRNELFFGGEFQFWDGAIPIVGGLIPPTSPAFAPLVNFNLAHGWPANGDLVTYLTALQTFDVGIPVAYHQGFGNPQVSNWEHYFGIYAQDSWKASRSLTIDFGGRLDAYAPASPVPRNIYFSPRLGFAWSPGHDQKTVIRGGGGIFVAPIPFFVGYVANLLGDSGHYINQVATALTPTDQRVLTLWAMLTGCDPQHPWLCTKQPPFPQLQAADVTAAGFEIGPGQPGRVVCDLRQPYKNNYSVQASLSVERQLGTNMAVEVGYQMYHGVHLQVPLDTNVRETGVVESFVGPLYMQIDPDLVQRGTSASTGSSIYHGMLASLRRRFASGLQFQVNYTFSKSIDDNTDFNNEFMPFRPTRINLERSVSTFDIRHNFAASAVYATPFKPGGGLLSHVMAGMKIAPVLFLRSGIPFTVRVPGMQNGTLGESLWARPWHAGRNTGIGPNFFSLDMRVSKSFYLEREAGRRVDLLVQGTNILNHTNFSAVNDSFPANPNPFQVGSQMVNLLDGPYNFRGIRGLDASQPLAFKAAFDPRQVQFGLRVIF